MEDELFPELRVVCPDCGLETEVPCGTEIADVLWLHQRRCEEATPELAVFCPACERDVAVPADNDPYETLFLHEQECPALPSFDVAS